MGEPMHTLYSRESRSSRPDTLEYGIGILAYMLFCTRAEQWFIKLLPYENHWCRIHVHDTPDEIETGPRHRRMRSRVESVE